MANKIEILENTLLKLLVRRGSDDDRQQVILSEGELGFTTDTDRLFIGDGSTAGGVVAGNKFLGCDGDPTSAYPDAVIGDMAYDTASKNLYAFCDPGVWEIISSNVSTGGGLSGDIVIEVDAGDVLPNALGDSIVLDGNGRMTLDCTEIKSDKLSPCNTTLTLPRTLKFGSRTLTFPTNVIGGRFLTTDSVGNLTWEDPVGAAEFFYNSENGPIPVGAVLPFTAAGIIPTGYIACDGQEVTKAAYPDLYDVIGESYGTTNTGVTFKVPDYINSTLYGSNTSPVSDSTEYKVGADVNLSSGTPGPAALVNFNGGASGTTNTGPRTIRSSNNIASVVKTGDGQYIVTFSTPMSDANYVMAGAAQYSFDTARGLAVDFDPDFTPTTTQCKIRTISIDSDPIPTSSKYVTLAFFDVNAVVSTPTTQSPLSAQGTIYVIKAIPDTVANPTLTVEFPLTASLDGVDQGSGSFSSIAGDVVIGMPDQDTSVPPGMMTYDTAGSHTFTTVTQYTKFYVTGSGGTGGRSSGGAAATVIGYLDLPVGTSVNVDVAAGALFTENLPGNLSRIIVGGTLLAQSDGAVYHSSFPPPLTFNDGTLNTGDSRVLDGHIIKGGSGGTDSNDGGEEADGAASYWGGCPAPGAGSVGHNGSTYSGTGDGIVMFEWT